MQRVDFERDAELVEFVEVGRWLFFASTMELFDPADGSSRALASWDDAFAVDGFAQEVADMRTVLIDFDGGRGSTSESGKEKTFSFNHASGGGDDEGKTMFPAEFNDGEKYQSFEKALAKFRNKHANSSIEYGITVDEQGYVHKYRSGGPTSVQIAGSSGHMVIHNHPSGGAFSDSDLLSVAQGKERGIVASGSKGDYIFTKSNGFNASGFAKAVKTAKMKGTSYDDAVDKWLKANQKSYGYKYEFRKA